MSNSLERIRFLLQQGGVPVTPKQDKRKLSFATNASNQHSSTKKIRKGTPYKLSNKNNIRTQPVQLENLSASNSSTYDISSDEWAEEEHDVSPTMFETGHCRPKTKQQKKDVNRSNCQVRIKPEKLKKRKASISKDAHNATRTLENNRQSNSVSNKKHKVRNSKDRQELNSDYVSTPMQENYENKYVKSKLSNTPNSNTFYDNSMLDGNASLESNDSLFGINVLSSAESLSSSEESLDSFRKSISGSICNETNPFEDDNNAADIQMNEDRHSHQDYTFYEIENGKIIVLTSNALLYVYGAFHLSVLYGKIDILGYKLEASSEEVAIYSPRSTSHLYLLNEYRDDNCVIGTTTLLKKFLSLGVKSNEALNMANTLSPNDTIILCKKIFDTKISYLKTHISQHIFPQTDFGHLDCEFSADFSGKSNLLKVGGNWDQLVQFVNDKSRIMLCGGKGVGKSTLLRYLINRTLMKYPKVLVIDLDPGQPEFTVSGCVSAVVVTKPIFGPNYTHLMKPKKCIFVKNIDVAHDPHSYLDSVKELVKTDLEFETMPTLINYMGYTKGFGLNLVAEIISMLSLTHLIQIKCNKLSRNYSMQLTMNNIKDMKGLNGVNVECAIDYHFVELISTAGENEHWQASSQLMREMGIISYFSQISANMSLTTSETTVYCIDLNKISIICDDKQCEAPLANGLMVALCECGTAINTYKCHGWGIVRGINTDSNKLYMITPVSSEELENVYYLIVGSVTLPASLYMTEDEKLGHVPYVSTGVSTQFHQVPKRTYIRKMVQQNVL